MQLGIILAPYGQIPGAYPSEIAYSYGGDGTFLCPDDPFFNTRGEEGHYYDTQLGGLGHSMPTDFELAPAYGYTPMIDGWVVSKEGFNPGSWIPPNGYSPSGAYGPPMAPLSYKSPGPLGDPTMPMTIDDVVATIQEQNQKMFTLSLITTIAVAVSALVATYRTAKQIRQLHH